MSLSLLSFIALFASVKSATTDDVQEYIEHVDTKYKEYLTRLVKNGESSIKKGSADEATKKAYLSNEFILDYVKKNDIDELDQYKKYENMVEVADKGRRGLTEQCADSEYKAEIIEHLKVIENTEGISPQAHKILSINLFYYLDSEEKSRENLNQQKNRRKKSSFTKRLNELRRKMQREMQRELDSFKNASTKEKFGKALRGAQMMLEVEDEVHEKVDDISDLVTQFITLICEK